MKDPGLYVMLIPASWNFWLATITFTVSLRILWNGIKDSVRLYRWYRGNYIPVGLLDKATQIYQNKKITKRQKHIEIRKLIARFYALDKDCYSFSEMLFQCFEIWRKRRRSK